MKKLPLLACLISLTLPALAEPAPIENIVKLLQEAKTSPSPLPLLEQAKQHLNKYKPGPNKARETLAGRGPKKQAAAQLVSGEMKGQAEHALKEAIEAAKAGSPNLVQKIDAAIAEVHQAGAQKHL